MKVPRANIETHFNDGRWYNRRQGTPGPFYAGADKADVQEIGRLAAQRESVEHIIRNEDETAPTD